MRIINKKYLLIIILSAVILTGVIIFKPKENIKLDNVILKQKINNKTFAMYTETDNGYEEYKGNTFPKGYRLNTTESKCIDNNGEEIKEALQEENGSITLTTNKSIYCYLYFDEKENLSNICNDSTMQECISNLDKLSKIKTIENLSSEKKGDMYRYQGQAKDVDNNYICFGTSDKEKCVKDPDHHMYRIIGIEAETGRVKVIKKEALDESIEWADDNQKNIEFPNSKIYETINGIGFLENINYVPESWEGKISDNTWIYGDMFSNDTIGASQTGEGLYLVETGQKETKWNNYATKETPDVQSYVTEGNTIYYTAGKGNWTQSIDEGKVSLMYLHDYYYSVSDTANCQVDKNEYGECQTGWMHLSQNDDSAPSKNEWTMSRYGWNIYMGMFHGHYINSTGYTHSWYLSNSYSVRPVFYINASQTLNNGLGTITNPYMIME